MSRSQHYIKLMNTRKWRALRMATMKRSNGLCEQCLKEGRVSAATEVHHIRPIESVKDPIVMEQLAYDPGNLAALCRQCHHDAHVLLLKGSKEERKRREKERMERFHEVFLGQSEGSEAEK
ncbi:MAG: HNH endonuclease [Muribaculaceae bacterium]|nr:HNH endonuclease [Muribaculaceae bacterium]